jgi:hypothetical protein
MACRMSKCGQGYHSYRSYSSRSKVTSVGYRLYRASFGPLPHHALRANSLLYSWCSPISQPSQAWSTVFCPEFKIDCCGLTSWSQRRSKKDVILYLCLRQKVNMRAYSYNCCLQCEAWSTLFGSEHHTDCCAPSLTLSNRIRQIGNYFVSSR